MKRLLLILILTLSFQSLTKADDIRDFQIEGISIGDSALDFFDKSSIKKNSKNYFTNKKYTRVQNDNLPFFKIYDAVDFAFKTKDENYIIQSLSGILNYENKDINDCYKKMNKIINEMDKIFSNQIKYPKRTYKHGNIKKNKSGKSTVTDVEYEFKNKDNVRVICYDYSIEHGSQDHLSITISKDEYSIFLSNEAYK